MALSEKGIAPCPDGAPGWRARERFMSCFENTRRETRSRNIIVSIIYSPCGPRNPFVAGRLEEQPHETVLRPTMRTPVELAAVQAHVREAQVVLRGRGETHALKGCVAKPPRSRA